MAQPDCFLGLRLYRSIGSRGNLCVYVNIISKHLFLPEEVFLEELEDFVRIVRRENTLIRQYAVAAGSFLGVKSVQRHFPESRESFCGAFAVQAPVIFRKDRLIEGPTGDSIHKATQNSDWKKHRRFG